MSANVEDQVAEDDVEDLDDLENIVGDNNAPHKSRQRKTGSEERNNSVRNTLADASDEACIANWCNARCRSHWHKIWGQRCGNHACDTGDPDESRACVRCTEGSCKVFGRTELGKTRRLRLNTQSGGKEDCSHPRKEMWEGEVEQVELEEVVRMIHSTACLSRRVRMMQLIRVADHLGASSRRPRHPFPALMAGEPLAVYLCTRP